MKFNLKSEFSPAGDQINAIDELVDSINKNKKHQVLLGATGTGKTFTTANVIQRVQKSTLIIVHNKTLAMQIFLEMKSFFPNNKVEYYVSLFDYYRPEAYKPNSDIFFEKRTQRNSSIEKMRMNTLNSLSTDDSVIVIASVASIYGCLDPERYKDSIIELKRGDYIPKDKFLNDLKCIGYNTEKKNLTIKESNNEFVFLIHIEEDFFFKVVISKIEFKIISLEKLWEKYADKSLFDLEKISISPVQYIIEKEEKIKQIIKKIENELDEQISFLNENGKKLEAKRLDNRIRDDLKDFKEFGFCSGVENYSLYFDGRNKGESPFVLLDFFPKGNFITIIEESHITIPQIRAMYNTDRNRKKTLVDYGFRLPSAIDNRPLNFDEFVSKLDNVIYVSATPGLFELNKVDNKITEQIIRPTGLLDPEIEVHSSSNQIANMISEINKRVKLGDRVLVYALTISMSDDISSYFQEQGIKAVSIHSHMDIFERYQIISNLRRGIYDVIVGINLLKEGIDIPEVSLVCIIDADKSGFLRDSRSLIQIIGRASRNKNGKVIFYANKLTKDMKIAISETERRRNIQINYNNENGIIPETIRRKNKNIFLDQKILDLVSEFEDSNLSFKEKNKIIRRVERMMKFSIKEFKFDKAIELRNILFDLRNLMIEKK